MKLNNKVYDTFKWLLITVVPASILLISTLGTIYNFDTEIITLTISAIATFIGTITGISNYNYKTLQITVYSRHTDLRPELMQIFL